MPSSKKVRKPYVARGGPQDQSNSTRVVISVHRLKKHRISTVIC